MGKRSRDKGKAGEREAAAKLSELFGCDVRRSQQYCGASEESDDLVGLPGVAVEVKRCERLNLHSVIEKTAADAAGKIPMVVHRRDRSEWLATVRLDDLPRLVSQLYLLMASDG